VRRRRFGLLDALQSSQAIDTSGNHNPLYCRHLRLNPGEMAAYPVG
jgi:hypothetical protein